MTNTRLVKQWSVTRAHLSWARDLLPELPVENRGELADQDLASLESYEQFLDQNELELALDQLEGLGDLNSPRGGFWKSLQRAANLMELPERAARFEARFHEALRALKDSDA